MAKKNAAPTKSQIIAAIADQTDLTKKQVSAVFDSLGGVMKKALKGAGTFTLPGVCKMRVVKKPATKAREGVNPFTKQPTTFPAIAMTMTAAGSQKPCSCVKSTRSPTSPKKMGANSDMTTLSSLWRRSVRRAGTWRTRTPATNAPNTAWTCIASVAAPHRKVTPTTTTSSPPRVTGPR